MPGLGEVFGRGSVAEQFLIYGVLQQLLGPLMNPLLVELQKDVWSKFPNAPADPGVVAQAFARRLITAAEAHDKGHDSGIPDGDMDLAARAATSGADMSLAAEALRRGLIGLGSDDPDQVSFKGMLTDAGVRPEWHDVLAKLATQIPTTAEVMNAWLEGQIDEGEARKRYLAAGGDPTWFQTSYNANGQAPTPVQALEMLNRGLIGQDGTGPESTSYHQAFLEGPWRNKWLAPFLGLREYLPPPRTVTAMVKEGTLSTGEAATLLAKQGLAPDMVTRYLQAGKATTASHEKHLAKGDVLAMYHDKLLTRAEATGDLVKLGYTAHDAAELVALQDVRMVAAQTTAAVTRVRTLYLAGKLTKAQAQQTLGQLGVTGGQVGDVVAVWDLEASRHVKSLTAAEVVSAWYYQLITQDDAVARLVTLGFDKADAFLILAVRNKGPLAGQAPGQPGGPLPGAKASAGPVTP